MIFHMLQCKFESANFLDGVSLSNTVDSMLFNAAFLSSSVFRCLSAAANEVNPPCLSAPWSRFVNTSGLGFMMTEALLSQISESHRKSRSFSKKNMKRKDGEPCERQSTNYCIFVLMDYYMAVPRPSKTSLVCLSYL